MKDLNEAIRLANSLITQGQFSAAIEIILPLLGLHTDNAILINLAGACYYKIGDKSKAAAWWDRSVSGGLNHAEAYANLGAVQRERGLISEAETLLRQALDLDRNCTEASHNLADLLHNQGRLAEAEALLRHVVTLRPHFVEGHVDLARTLRSQGQTADAETSYRSALLIDPEHALANNNLALLFHEQRRFAEAEEYFRRALQSDPYSPDAHINLARLLFDLARYDEAELHARRSIQLNAEVAYFYLILGAILSEKNAGDLNDAIRSFQRAIELAPDDPIPYTSLAYTLLFHCEDGDEVLEACRKFSERFEAHSSAKMTYLNDPSSERRLRIGYVSPDFKHHCQSYFTIPLLTNHRRDAFEIYCYSSVHHPDLVTEHIASLADVWRPVAHLDDQALANAIVNDKIDILVDLTMHMRDGRPLLFARKPAPVQVAWLAYPGTTGSTAIAYRLTDPWLDPTGDAKADTRYSERSIRLPDTFWCYDPLTLHAEIAPLPADRNGSITFGCLNNPRKLTKRTFLMWASVLRQVHGSRMVLLVAEGHARGSVASTFESLGVSPSRLIFVDYQPRSTYLQTYERIDIALDTFPYNGHTTSLDSFWMGVPVVTTVGKVPASRAGYAMLANLGLSELAAATDEDFVRVAMELALDLPRLRQIRSTLRQRMEGSALMDDGRFAQGIEQAYRSMWKEWCNSNGFCREALSG